MENEWSEFDRDQLKEVANIAASKASTALSQMVGSGVNIGLPHAYIGPVEKAPSLMGQSDHLATVVLLRVLGDIRGLMMLQAQPRSALDLSCLVRRIPRGSRTELEEMDRSALKEIGNIIFGSAITALAQMLDLNLFQSLPDTTTDMSGSVMDSIVGEMGKTDETVMVLTVDFSVTGAGIGGTFLIVVDPRSSRTILDAAGKHLRKKPKA